MTTMTPTEIIRFVVDLETVRELRAFRRVAVQAPSLGGDAGLSQIAIAAVDHELDNRDEEGS